MPHSKNPSETLTKEVFLIRRISPVSNSPLSHNTPLLCFRPHACLITFCRLGQIGALEGGRGGKAMGGEGGKRVDVAGRKEQDIWELVEGMWCWLMLQRMWGQQDLDHSDSITTRPHLINPPAFVIISPLCLFCFFPLFSLCIPVHTQKPWGKVLTSSTLRRT